MIIYIRKIFNVARRHKNELGIDFNDMRYINEIIIHCSATKEALDFNVNDLRRWHKAQGWKDVGYHFVITLDGTIEQGRALEEIGSHTKGHNAHSIGICYIGGISKEGKPKDTRTIQ